MDEEKLRLLVLLDTHSNEFILDVCELSDYIREYLSREAVQNAELERKSLLRSFRYLMLYQPQRDISPENLQKLFHSIQMIVDYSKSPSLRLEAFVLNAINLYIYVAKLFSTVPDAHNLAEEVMTNYMVKTVLSHINRGDTSLFFKLREELFFEYERNNYCSSWLRREKLSLETLMVREAVQKLKIKLEERIPKKNEESKKSRVILN